MVTPAGPAPGGSRARWLIGGGLAVAAVAAVALAASFLAASPLPEALKYLPRDSAVVAELRPELPGDQRQHLGNFLAHFPGFEDQSTLDDKLDEVLGRITRESSNGEIDYATRIKPLLAGPLAVSVTADALAGMMTGSTPDGVLVVATTDGTATCESVLGATTVATTHRQVEIRIVRRDVVCALHQRYLLVGTVTSIKDGLDARLDGTGVDGSVTYRAARAKLQGDQVASLYVDMDPLYDALLDAAGPLGMDMATMPEGLWLMSGVRVTNDALIVDAYAPVDTSTLPSDAPTSAPAAESRFATILPTDTLGYLELHGVGASVDQVLAAVRAEPTTAAALDQLEAALRAIGGTANLTGWIEDLAVAVVPTDGAAGAAVLIRGTDAATAAARLTQIRNLLVLTATGTDITLSDSDHNGVTVTTVDLGDLSSLVGPMGFPVSLDGERLEIAFAARDDLVVIAGGGGIVERILDVEAGSSLATSNTYRRVIEIAGARNNLQYYVALDSTLALVERFLPVDELEQWTTEFKPYLEHLAGFAMTAQSSSSMGRMRTVITVK
ncbi:MAG: DUF3352 domain-containing protein [Chloroflexota bacterium]